MSEESRRRGGPRDPERRDRIIRAAIDVIVEQGTQGLTHRAVARAAGVPLGSTTYYFRDLDELLNAALSRATEDFRADVWEWHEQLPADADLVNALTDLLVDQLSGSLRSRVVMRIELAHAALRHPGLEPAYATWATEIHNVLLRRVEEPAASALMVLLTGYQMLIATADQHLDRAQVEAVLRRVLDRPLP